jgi:hypothetical protein
MLAGTSPLIFATNATERLRIIDTGEVGIGTTNPLQRLQIGTANTLGINTNGTVFVVTSNADVGIGTTNPTSKLTVLGGDISVGTNNSHGVILTSPDGTRYRLVVNNAGALSTVAI